MTKIFKFDLYKISHSIWFWVVCVLVVADALAWVVPFYVGSNMDMSILSQYTQTLNSAAFVVILFAVFFGSMDYNTGFEKNLTETNKFKHTLSKIIITMTFALAMFLVMFAVIAVFNLIFTDEVFYNPYVTDEFGNKVPLYKDFADADRWSIGNFFAYMAIKFLLFSGVGIGTLLFTMVVRKRIVAVVVSLLYLFLGGYLFIFVNSLLGNNTDISDYSLLDRSTSFLLSADFEERFPSVLILGAVYFAVFVLLLFALAWVQTQRKPKIVNTDSCERGDVLEICNITKKFGKKSVLNACSVNIRDGEIYGILGNNGAGKSTLLKIICGMLKPNAGEIRFCADKEKNRIPQIGVLIESPGLYTELTAFQNLKAKAICLGYDNSEKTLNELLEKVGLQDVGKKKVGRFSTGMKQRLGIALAIMGEPDILVLDEPLNGLDIQGINDLRKMILDLHKQSDVTILISSHILDELFKVATSFVILKNGTILRTITTEQIVEEKGDLPIDEYYLKIVGGEKASA